MLAKYLEMRRRGGRVREGQRRLTTWWNRIRLLEVWRVGSVVDCMILIFDEVDERKHYFYVALIDRTLHQARMAQW